MLSFLAVFIRFLNRSDMDIYDTVKERADKIKSNMPASKGAQKEFLRGYLARSQDKFEECMMILAECDPKTFCQIQAKLMMHMIPKQTEIDVKHGISNDYNTLAALGMTKTDDVTAIGMRKVEEIHDYDFQELTEIK